MTRDLLIKTDELIVNDTYQMFLILADNTQPMNDIVSDGDWWSYRKSRTDLTTPREFKLSIKFAPIDDIALCPSSCSNNGVCKYDPEVSVYPYCHCLKDWAGADCAVSVIDFEANQKFQL